MRARIGRLIAISIAIILGVAFVVGSFVLADSMRSGFDSLFKDAFANTDLQVRTALAFGESDSTQPRDPVPADLVDTVAAVPGWPTPTACCSAAPRSSTPRARR